MSKLGHVYVEGHTRNLKRLKREWVIGLDATLADSGLSANTVVLVCDPK